MRRLTAKGAEKWSRIRSRLCLNGLRCDDERHTNRGNALPKTNVSLLYGSFKELFSSSSIFFSCFFHSTRVLATRRMYPYLAWSCLCECRSYVARATRPDAWHRWNTPHTVSLSSKARACSSTSRLRRYVPVGKPDFSSDDARNTMALITKTKLRRH